MDIAPPKYKQIHEVLRAKYRDYMHISELRRTRRLVMHYIVNRVSACIVPVYFSVLTQYNPIRFQERRTRLEERVVVASLRL